MNRRLFPMLMLCILILCWPMAVYSQDAHDLQSVQAEGNALIVGNNLARAQREAIQDALKVAVEKTVVQWLSPDVVAGQTKILKEKVYSAADAYILTYKIMAELPSQKVYTVNMIANVDYSALMGELKALGIDVTVKAPQAVIVSMTVHGIRSLPDYADFINCLRNDMDGIKDARVRQVRQGSIRLDLDMVDTLASLADKLGRVGKFSFHLNQINQNEIEIKLIN